MTRLDVNNLVAEIFRIKARQREYEMHDEWCQRRQDQLAFSSGRAVRVRDCNCWLVNEQ